MADVTWREFLRQMGELVGSDGMENDPVDLLKLLDNAATLGVPDASEVYLDLLA